MGSRLRVSTWRVHGRGAATVLHGSAAGEATLADNAVPAPIVHRRVTGLEHVTLIRSPASPATPRGSGATLGVAFGWSLITPGRLGPGNDPDRRARDLRFRRRSARTERGTAHADRARRRDHGG